MIWKIVDDVLIGILIGPLIILCIWGIIDPSGDSLARFLRVDKWLK